MPKVTIKRECESCRGTGLYSGMCEAKDEAVICHGCDGTGCETVQYTPFTKRQKKTGIKRVRESRGTFIGTGVGGVGAYVTYAEFTAGKRPKRS